MSVKQPVRVAAALAYREHAALSAAFVMKFFGHIMIVYAVSDRAAEDIAAAEFRLAQVLLAFIQSAGVIYHVAVFVDHEAVCRERSQHQFA